MSLGLGSTRQALIAVGGVAAMLGLFWDDAWHTDVGRDDIWSPPHLLLYAGVALLLLVIADWARRRRGLEGRVVLRDPTVVLPLFGAAVTLGAAPVDEAWHQLFGRDAVVWSPPHMVAVAGMTAFAAGLLLATRRGTASGSRWATAVIGAFLIAAAGTAVMEYEADVPQFAVVWYLPVLMVGLVLSFALIRRAVGPGWSVPAAGAVHMGLRTAIVGFLAVLGHSVPTVMPTLVPALAFELALRRGWSRGRLAAAVTAATVASHVPAHLLQAPGLSFTTADVVAGAVLGWFAAWAVLSALQVGASTASPARTAARVGVPVMLLVVPSPWAAPSAWAHDPGQGVEVAPAVLRSVRDGDVVEVSLDGVGCRGWRPHRVVARRAGQERVGSLEATARCRYAGEVVVDDPGRWFVYVEVVVSGEATEAWIPVEQGAHEKGTALYLVSAGEARAVQIVAGVLLYGVVLAILGAVVLAYRRVDHPFWGQRPEAAAGAASPRKVYR
jgi:hypothetical protein